MIYRLPRRWPSALDYLDDSDAMHCGVILAESEAFRAGMDLKTVAAGGPQPITASRGARQALGLVSDVVASPDLATTARAIAASAPLAVQASKELLHAALDWLAAEAMSVAVKKYPQVARLRSPVLAS